jgi:hypothetical protein
MACNSHEDNRMRYTGREALSDDEACDKARLYDLEAPS